ADLPVKAKPVEYVKVCSLYSAGYYYIPGTDICMKIGGYVRAEYGWGNIGNSFTNLDNTGPDGQRTRISGPDYNQRARTILVQETRQQTAYGTLRTYMNIGITFVVGVLPVADQIKVRYPDIVANLRVDQAWGGAQIMGALHDASGGYYGTTLTGVQGLGHPSDKMGFAAGAGIKINTPWVSPGDYLQAQVNYTQGAVRYAALTPSGAGSPGIFKGGDSFGIGWFSDGVYCGTVAGAAATVACPAGASGVDLTTAWTAHAAYEHFWTPSLRTSLVGGYTK